MDRKGQTTERGEGPMSRKAQLLTYTMVLGFIGLIFYQPLDNVFHIGKLFAPIAQFLN